MHMVATSAGGRRRRRRAGVGWGGVLNDWAMVISAHGSSFVALLPGKTEGGRGMGGRQASREGRRKEEDGWGGVLNDWAVIEVGVMTRREEEGGGRRRRRRVY